MPKANILIVDDEPDLVELIALTLSRMGLGTQAAHNVQDAQRLLLREHFDLCLSDMRLPDGDGLGLVDWLQEHRPSTPVAIITAHGNVETAVRALKAGAFDFVSKPLDLGVLRRLVLSALKLSERQDGSITFQGPRLLGNSPPMQQLRELIARVARSQAPVHIAGESGTGKELVARMIHRTGPRAEGPFIPVNCGAIPAELMESEFFGHKRGSFTGAVADKKGLFASAEGGTLFLDEVADLPLHMQVKLLRVIQEKTLRPVGETQELPVDVRVLSATHKNLTELVGLGRFREDLYYRIDVIELRVPALRERAGDIPELADSILLRLGRRMQLTAPRLDPPALRALQGYAFPGNVRELENILERAMTLCATGSIGVADLQLRSGGAVAHVSEAQHPDGPPDEDFADQLDDALGGGNALGEQLESVEREAIVKALEKSRYNKTAAAKLLGMSFRALRYRIKKLGIE
ncbi:MAG: sigma-54 dependent transcriptional regulator [Pseudomonadota bacterium]